MPSPDYSDVSNSVGERHWGGGVQIPNYLLWSLPKHGSHQYERNLHFIIDYLHL